MRVKVKTIILIISLIGYMKPACVVEFEAINSIFDFFRIVGFGLSILYAAVESIKISNFTKGIALYELLFVAITFFRSGNIAQAIVSAATIIGEMLLLEIAIKGGKDTLIHFLDTINTILALYVIINLISIITLPNGIALTENNTPVYFLGIPNRFVFWMLPFIVFLCISTYQKGKRIGAVHYIFYLLCVGTLISKNSLGASIGMILFAVYYFLAQNHKAKWADYKVFIILYIIVWALITFANTIDISTIGFVSFYNKTDNILARLSLWNRAKEYLATNINHLILGYGLEADKVIRNKFWYDHVHNNLLNVIYLTGIAGGTIYAASFFGLIRQFRSFRETKEAKILLGSICAFLVMLLFDTYDLYGHFYLLGTFVSNLAVIKPVADRVDNDYIINNRKIRFYWKLRI